MTAEMVLLLGLYAFFIIGIFMHREKGLYYSFHGTLPYLSARIEQHTATGSGFFSTDKPGGMTWDAP